MAAFEGRFSIFTLRHGLIRNGRPPAPRAQVRVRCNSPSKLLAFPNTVVRDIKPRRKCSCGFCNEPVRLQPEEHQQVSLCDGPIALRAVLSENEAPQLLEKAGGLAKFWTELIPEQARSAAAGELQGNRILGFRDGGRETRGFDIRILRRNRRSDRLSFLGHLGI